MIKEDKIVLYGGTTSSEENIQNKSMRLLNDLYIFNFKQRLWEEPIVGGNYPSPKINSAFSCNYPQLSNVSGELILVGGADDLFYKSSFVEMKMYILAQTEGQNWKLDWKEKLNTEISMADDDDDSQSMAAPVNAVFLSDKEILEEEYSKAESTIQKLKQEVSEMEINLKQEKLKNLRMKESLIMNNAKTKSVSAETEQFIGLRDKEIGDLTMRKNCNLVIISNLLESLALKIKQRKIIQARIFALEQGMSAAEDFIVHLDKFFSDAIQRRPLSDFRNVLG